MLCHKIALFLCCLILFGHSELYCAPQQTPPPPLPPFCVSSQSRVFIDSSADIILHFKGSINNEPIKFFIRKRPNYGDLGEIRRISYDTAAVKYTPKKGIKPVNDSFTFAAQFQGSPVSAPGKVDILIEERPALLNFDTKLDFGIVPLGDVSLQNFQIMNQGGVTAKVNINTKEPWTIYGNSSYEIKGGEKTDIQVQFTPIEEGAFAGRLLVQGLINEKPLYIELSGSCIKPVSSSKEGILISSSMRKDNIAEIIFFNHTGLDRSLRIEWPDFMEAQQESLIPANGSTRVPVSLKNVSPNFSHKGSIPFQSGNFSSTFPILIQPAPANILIQPHDLLDLGEVSVGDIAKGKLIVSNEGGQSTKLKVIIPQEVNVSPDPATTLIQPNSKVEFDVSWKMLKSGTFSVPLCVDVECVPLPPINLKASAKAAQPVEKLLRVTNPKEAAKSQAEIFAAIPPVNECFVVEQTEHSVKIKWKLPSPEIKNYVVERRYIKQSDDGKVLELWERYNNVNVQICDEFATAHFYNLGSGTFLNIRLRGIDQKGLIESQNGGHFRIQTKDYQPWEIPFWIWIPALLGTLAMGLIFLRKRFQIVF